MHLGGKRRGVPLCVRWLQLKLRMTQLNQRRQIHGLSSKISVEESIRIKLIKQYLHISSVLS